MSDSTTSESTPIVIQFPDRGACAVDYIDYFDEGVYGPNKPFFVGRFKTVSKVAEQIKACLALQTTPGSLIHFNRTNLPDSYVEPLTPPDEKFPHRAKYYIRFMLRFKFYGDFGYIDIGRKWRDGDINDDGTLANPAGVALEDLEVLNYCWISGNDAEYILSLIKEGASTLVSDDSAILTDGETILSI